MRRIDAENDEFLGEEGQFLQRKDQRAVVGVAFDVGIR